MSRTVEQLEARIVALEQANAELRRDLREEQKERKSHEDAARGLCQRIKELEAMTDPDEICEYVHDFLRAANALPGALDAPLKLAPHDYRTGLYDAVQKVCSP